MLFLGRIGAVSASKPIDPDQWLSIIDSHVSLAHGRPQIGIYPFTKRPQVFKPVASSAHICVAGTRVGAIWWALDGSPFLMVQAEEHATEAVAAIAEDVARLLGGQFVPDVHM